MKMLNDRLLEAVAGGTDKGLLDIAKKEKYKKDKETGVIAAPVFIEAPAHTTPH